MAAAMIESSNNQSACSSPRLSFSHDIQQQGSMQHPQQAAESNDYSRLDKSLSVDEEDPAAAPEFKFCFDVATRTDRTDDVVDGVSPADELFMNGVLLPINGYHQIITNKNNTNHCKNMEDDSSQQICREMKTEPEEEEEEKDGRRQVPQQQEEKEEEMVTTTRATLIRESEKSSSNYNYSKSFWRFNRSSSLNSSYESNKKTSTNSSSFWSLHLLSRSNSTGSSSAPAPIKHKGGGSAASANVSANQKQALMNNSGSSGAKSLSSSSSSSNRKPPLVKQQSYNYGGSNNPVLNVPPPYIAKGTSDLLGLASFFRNGGNGKDKKNKKR